MISFNMVYIYYCYQLYFPTIMELRRETPSVHLHFSPNLKTFSFSKIIAIGFNN